MSAERIPRFDDDAPPDDDAPRAQSVATLARNLARILTIHGRGILGRVGVDPAISVTREPANPRACAIEGCPRPRNRANGLCAAHEYRRAAGLPLSRPLRETRRFDDAQPCGRCGAVAWRRREFPDGRLGVRRCGSCDVARMRAGRLRRAEHQRGN